VEDVVLDKSIKGLAGVDDDHMATHQVLLDDRENGRKLIMFQNESTCRLN